MFSLSHLLRKQGQYLLENDRHALVYIAVLALMPFAQWLSVAIIALITLRKGWLAGYRSLVIGVLAHLMFSLLSTSFFVAMVTSVTAFLPCYLMALVLRVTINWQWTMSFIVLQVMLWVSLLHWLAPEFILHQYQYFQALLKELDNNLSFGLVFNQGLFDQTATAHYLVGVECASMAASAVASLMLARSVQSKLFCPNGFKQEIMAFRASNYGVILLALIGMEAYQHNSIALSCLPILVMYYAAAGLSLSFNIFAKNKRIGTLFLLIAPLVIVPFVMLAVYVSFGVLDSLFNFRVHLLCKASEKRE